MGPRGSIGGGRCAGAVGGGHRAAAPRLRDESHDDVAARRRRPPPAGAPWRLRLGPRPAAPRGHPHCCSSRLRPGCGPESPLRRGPPWVAGDRTGRRRRDGGGAGRPRSPARHRPARCPAAGSARHDGDRRPAGDHGGAHGRGSRCNPPGAAGRAGARAGVCPAAPGSGRARGRPRPGERTADGRAARAHGDAAAEHYHPIRARGGVPGHRPARRATGPRGQRAAPWLRGRLPLARQAARDRGRRLRPPPHETRLRA